MSKIASSAGVGAKARPLPFKALNLALDAASRLKSLPTLDPYRLMLEAQRSTGLHDFGGHDFVEPLAVLCDSIEREARVHPLGRLILAGRLKGTLASRLRAEHLIRQRPEILEIPIEAPIVIAGLQRTGTTMLHRLLAADPRVRSLASWEALSPVPQKLGVPRERDPRIRTSLMAEQGLRVMAPEFFAIHPVETHAPEEDVLLLDLAFRSTSPEATLNVPTYARYIEENDPLPAYRYLKRMMQILSFQHRRARWVLKTPHHLEFLDALVAVFPDAKIVQTHRDPRKTTASFASMVAHGRAIFSDEVDPREVGRHWGRKITRMVDHGMKSRVENPAMQVLDVSYYDLLKDPVAEVERVFSFAGLEFTESTKRSVLATKEKNPKGKYGSHAYRLEDFGLDAGYIEEHLGAYRAAHAIPIE